VGMSQQYSAQFPRITPRPVHPVQQLPTGKSQIHEQCPVRRFHIKCIAAAPAAQRIQKNLFHTHFISKKNANFSLITVEKNIL
jgi:hypothetical protein